MTAHLLDSEIRMLNQIAANFSWDDDPARAAAAVADHLRRFWSPQMREQLLRADADGALDLDPLARRALHMLETSA
jgi:formate dehydrogenase subunit delta